MLNIPLRLSKSACACTFILTKYSIDLLYLWICSFFFSQLVFIQSHWVLMYVICKQWRNLQIRRLYILILIGYAALHPAVLE